MSDIQFVFERPQKPARQVKKRSRLITSCDACRLRKIKCRLTGPSEDGCEACAASGSACVFEERNRIRRQRGIATFTVAPTRHSQRVNSRASPSTSIPIIVAAIQDGSSVSGSSTPLPLAPRKRPSHRRASGRDPGQSNTGPPTYRGGGQHSTKDNLDAYLLFDPHRQDYPHPKLLPHLVNLFFLYAGGMFPFFDSVEIGCCAQDGSLSPLLANCFATYSARFSDEIHHVSGQRYLSGEVFLDTAKCLLADETSSNLERLHATILIAWAENGSGRAKSFLMYSQMASCQAADLQLYSEEHILQDPCEESRNQSRLTFWAVVWLDIIACSVNGKCCLLRLDECSAGMPHPEAETCGTLSRIMLYQAFKGVLNLMVSLNLCSNYGKPSVPTAYRDIGLRQIQLAAESFKEWLPPSFAFTRENLSFSSMFRESYAFYLVHVLMHCFLVISHCPSIFWTSQPPKTITEMPRLDIAWSSATIIIDMLTFVESEKFLFITGGSSAFLPLSIARGALALAQTDMKNAIHGTSVTIDEFRLLNGFYLTRSAEMLRDVSKYWAGGSHVEISSESVALYGTQTVSQDPKGVPFSFPSPHPNALGTMPSSGGGSLKYLEGRRELEGAALRDEDNWRASAA